MLKYESVLFLVPAFWVAICLVNGTHYNIEYDCGFTDIVTVKNPDTNTFRSATAGNNNTICNVTKYDNVTVFTVYNCSKDVDILFTLSTREDDNATGDGIMGGSYSETYILKCLEIPVGGVIFNYSLGMAVKAEGIQPNASGTPGTDDYTEAPVTPSFTLISTILDSTETTEVDNATMGQHLRWKISGPFEYDLLPYTCSGNAGSSPGLTPQISLVEEGCPSVELISLFEPTSSTATERGELITDLFAFKWPTADDITLVCLVKICTRGGAACTVPTCDKRRRRAVHSHHDSNDGSTIRVVRRLSVAGFDNGTNRIVVSYFPMTSVFAVVLYYLHM